MLFAYTLSVQLIVGHDWRHFPAIMDISTLFSINGVFSSGFLMNFPLHSEQPLKTTLQILAQMHSSSMSPF